jgi:Mrp family chromosome partitioning ATPase
MADMVVIDTPAAALVADALHIAPFADCILQVIGAGKVTEGMARDTIASIDAAAPNRMLFIVNNATLGNDAMGKQYYKAYFGHQNGNGHSNGNGNGTSGKTTAIALNSGKILAAPPAGADESQEVAK